MSVSEKSISIGTIDYWNMFPFNQELSSLDLNSLKIKVSKDIPSNLNSKLNNGKLDVAICSSICLLDYVSTKIALPLGVVCDGPVQSVYLGFQENHKKLFNEIQSRLDQTSAMRLEDSLDENINQLMNIYYKLGVFEGQKIDYLYSSESATSNVMAGVILSILFGYQNIFHFQKNYQYEKDTAPIEVLIGDTALSKKNNFYRTLDLGLAWKKITNLPFVYAVWQSSESEIHDELKKLLLSVGLKSQNNMTENPHIYLKNKPKNFDIHSYWKNIYYEIKEKELLALKCFLTLASKYGYSNISPQNINLNILNFI